MDSESVGWPDRQANIFVFIYLWIRQAVSPYDYIGKSWDKLRFKRFAQGPNSDIRQCVLNSRQSPVSLSLTIDYWRRKHKRCTIIPYRILFAYATQVKRMPEWVINKKDPDLGSLESITKSYIKAILWMIIRSCYGRVSFEWDRNAPWHRFFNAGVKKKSKEEEKKIQTG